MIKYLNNSNLYSVSRYQPKLYHYNDLDMLGAYDTDGNSIKLSISGLDGYKTELWKYYVSRWEDITNWLNNLDNNNNDILCCWCPYSNSTRTQIKKYNSFVCHTGLIGKLVNKYRPDIDIILDKDRYMKLHNDYKPNKYGIIDI